MGDDWLDQWDGPDLGSTASKSDFDEEVCGAVIDCARERYASL